jgi:hypothetical protein
VSSRHITQDQVDSWLHSWGFRENPFHFWEANREAHIDEYYVKHKFYEQLLASSISTMVFAYRGEGKTATRIMLQRECQPHKYTSDTFTIPFSDFSSIIEEKYNKHGKVLFVDYLPLLIYKGILSLLCSCVFILREDEKFTNKELSKIKFWIDTFAPKILDEDHIDSIIREVWKRISKAEIDNSRVDSWRKFFQGGNFNLDNLPYKENPFWIKFFFLWVQLRNTKPFKQKTSNIGEISSKLVMQDFVRFLQEILSKGKYPCRKIFYLFDGIDEYDDTRGAPEVSSKVLSPLLWEMWFHRIDGLANKFFLPMEQKNKFISPDTRWDLFEIFDLDWQYTKDDFVDVSIMRKLLRERIHYFSSDGKNTISQMCEPEIGRLIEDEMIAEADHSPRNLIRLGNMIFSEHCNNNSEPKSLITAAEWEIALRKYRAGIHMARRENNISEANNIPRTKKNTEPKLIIKQAARKVFRGEEEIILSATEFDLLSELNRKVGQICSEEELIDALYKQDFTKKLADGLRSHIRHLRKKIEPKGKRGYFYIKNVRGRGYILENVER